MSRPYFKNDLFHYTGAINHANKNRILLTQQNKQSQSQSDQLVIQGQQKHKQFDAASALKFNIKQDKPAIDIDDQIRQVFQQAKNKKKNDCNNNTNSNTVAKPSIIFTPKCTLKTVQPKTQPDKLSVREQFQQKRKQKQQMWRLRQDLGKAIGAEQIVTKKNQNQHQKTPQAKHNQPNKQQSQVKQGQNKNQQDSQNQKQQSKKKGRAKTTGKKKMIKKQANYVKTDLKRKYRDRFLGGINKNLRMLTKNGKMKTKYMKSKVGTQLQMNDGDLYNSYTISLSKALCITVNLDDDQISQQQKLNYEIPQTYQKQNLQKLISQLFGFSSFRQGQYQTIKNILQNKSTLFVSQTASGKSLTYLLTSVILKGLSIILSPLVSLMLDQIDHLPSDLPAACISSLLNHDQKDRIINMVKQGKIQLLYITPQSFLTDFMYHVQYFPLINFVCIDEAHSMSELSHSFRASYLSLEDIINKYFKYKSGHPTVLCLTATANQQTMESICQKLNIKEVIRSKSIINKNLFVTISRQNLTAKYNALLEYISHPQIKKCKGILIYTRTKKIMFQVFNYLKNSSVACYIYHSGLEQRQKVQTIEKFRRGQIRVVIATVALGMGLDFQSLQCVIHINMPKSVENYIQQIGRAGRRQKRAYCHLFLDKDDYFTERNYFLADQLEKDSFAGIITILKQGIVDRRRKVKNDSEKKQKQKQRQGNNQQIQTQNLKRLSLDEPEQDDKKQNKQQIFYEEDYQELKQVKNNQILSSDKKQQQIKENKKIQQQLVEQNNAEVEQQLPQNNQFMPLNYCKAEAITQKAGLKQQAILNILLKMQKNLTKRVLKILPMSYQTIKISFFKKNEQTIKQQSQFYNKLISNTKIAKGTIYISLITKCNQLQLHPIMLLTQIYGISNKYSLKIELITQIFVWQHQISLEYTFKKLQNKQMFNKIMQQFNMVQRTALTKFNIFYSLCFNNSNKNMSNIITKKLIISDKQQLPQNSIITNFDQYFKQDTYQYYNAITKQAQVQGQQTLPSSTPNQLLLQNNNNIQHFNMYDKQAAYLPITNISQQDYIQISRCVQLFIKHILINNIDKKFIQTLKPYRDGRIMARVFLGVNDTNSNWKTYGEHPYWRKFVDKDYRKLLKIVRKSITQYVIRQGPRLLSIEEEKKKVQNVKKQ